MEAIDILWASEFNMGFGDVNDFKMWYKDRFGVPITDEEAKSYLCGAQIYPPEN